MDHHGSKFTLKIGGVLTFFAAHYGSRLPIAMANGHIQEGREFLGERLSAESSGFLNIPKVQEELLLWYGILEKYGIHKNQKMMSSREPNLEPIISPKLPGV